MRARPKPYNRKEWTEREVGILRAAFDKAARQGKRMPTAKVAKRLRRKTNSVQAKALRLGYSCDHRWTEEEDRILLLHYGLKPRTLLAKLKRRTLRGIQKRLVFLGKRVEERRQGYVPLSTFAREAGFSFYPLCRLLEYYEVPFKNLSPTPLATKVSPPRQVSRIEAEEAVEQYLACERLPVAARRLKVSGTFLRVVMHANGIEPNFPAGLKRLVYHLPPATYDEALAVYRAEYETSIP